MKPKILVIDDCLDTQRLIKARLSGEPVEILSAFDGESGISSAISLEPDLILLDVDMPGRDGFAVCAELKNRPATMDIPVIFLTAAATSTQDKIRGLELGAVDYITKPFDPAEMLARVRASLRTHELVELLSKKARIDGLTGLWNRAYLDLQVAAESVTAKRTRRPLSCIMADVDRFKTINDRFGHSFGDEVLRAVATSIAENCRQFDVVCRYGGEEFTILLPNTPLSEAGQLAGRLRIAVESMSMTYHGAKVPITCSFGVANLREPIPPTMLELADQALYRAKQLGRNRVEVSTDSRGAFEAQMQEVAVPCLS